MEGGGAATRQGGGRHPGQQRRALLFRFQVSFSMGMIFGLFTPAFAQKTAPVLFSIYGRVFAQVGFCRSLPYASPPVGDLRWAHPQPPPVPGWEGTRNGRCCYFSNFSGSGQIILNFNVI